MSCLFDSLSYFLKYNSNEIRQIICDYLEGNNPIIDGLDTKFVLDLDDPNYIENMRKNYQWGGGIEIQAACNIWNIRIIIHNIRSNKRYIEFLPISKQIYGTVELSWNGYHFEAIANGA